MQLFQNPALLLTKVQRPENSANWERGQRAEKAGGGVGGGRGREVRDESCGFLINSVWPSFTFSKPAHQPLSARALYTRPVAVAAHASQSSNPQLSSHTATAMKEVKSKDFWRAVLAELVGMTLFIFLSISTAIGNKNNDKPDQEVKVSLAFGLAIATLAQSLGHISGAHLNPAVTLGMLASCQISVFKAVMYIVAQMLGSALASGIIYGARPSTTDALGLNSVSGASSLLSTVFYIICGHLQFDNGSGNTSQKCDATVRISRKGLKRPASPNCSSCGDVGTQFGSV